MAEIKQVVDRSREAQVRELETEYFGWVNAQLYAEFQITLDIQKMIAGDIANMEIYFPPLGGLFVAEEGEALAGMIFLTPLREGVGQIRRMYVREAYRRQGIARALFVAAVEQARAAGYTALLLESPRSWSGAHALYKEMGFKDVLMYPESEVPEHLRKYWVFMQLSL